MAYSYEDFTSAAKKAGVLDSFDANDLDYAKKYPEFGLSMVSLKRDLGNAKTNEQKLLATEAMNQLRKDYGSYWTGESGNRSYAASYGSDITKAMDAVNNYGPYKSQYGDQIGSTLKNIGSFGDYKSPYEKQIAEAQKKIGSYGEYSTPYGKMLKNLTGSVGEYGPYNSEYSKQIAEAQKAVGSYGDFIYSGQNDYKNLLDSIANRERFRYNPDEDPLYGSYKKAYLREGDRAAANALATSAAATGGMASSYANTAAQQAANYYAGQLADIIPDLRERAYNEYANDYAMLLQALGAMDTDRGQEYQAFTDKYSRLQNNLQNLLGLDATAYGRYGDRYSQLLQSLAAVQDQDDTAYSRWSDAYSRLQNNLGNLMNLDQTAYGRYGDRYTQLLNTLAALQGQDQTEYGRYTDQYSRLQKALENIQGQDESDYKRYLDMLNAEYQRDRDAVADAQQELATAITIYQLTGQITGPLKDLLGNAAPSAAVAPSSSGGDGGGVVSAGTGKTETAKESPGGGILGGTGADIIAPGTPVQYDFRGIPLAYSPDKVQSESTSNGIAAGTAGGSNKVTGNTAAMIAQQKGEAEAKRVAAATGGTTVNTKGFSGKTGKF